MGTPLVLFVGGRTGDFEILAGSATEDAGSWAFDPTYSDCSLALAANSVVKGAFTDASNAPHSVSAGHSVDVVGRIFETRFGQIVAGGVLYLYDSSGHPWVRINSPTNGDIQLQYNSGTGASPVWSNLGTAITVGLGGVLNLSVGIDAGGVHSVMFAVGGTAHFVGTFTNAGLVSLDYLVIVNTDPGGGMYLSEVAAAQDMGLVGAHLKTMRATGAGSNSAWTGAYTDVNEVVTSDANYNVSTASGQKQSYAMTDISLPPQYTVASVVHKIRARNDGGVSSTQNVQSLARSGGTDYNSSNLSGIASAYGQLTKRYDVDPATGTAWTQTAVNALELGFESAT